MEHITLYDTICKALRIHDSMSLKKAMNEQHYNKIIKELPDGLIYTLVYVILQVTSKTSKHVTDQMDICIKSIISDVRNVCLNVDNNVFMKHSLFMMCYVLRDFKVFSALYDASYDHMYGYDIRYLLCYNKKIAHSDIHTIKEIPRYDDYKYYIGSENTPFDDIRCQIHSLLMELDEYDLRVMYVTMMLEVIT